MKAEPNSWASEPLKIMGPLPQATYIHHYLRGLATNLTGVPIEKVFDAIAFVRTRWVAARLGDDDFDFDRNWRGAEGALVDLNKSLADSGVGLVGRRGHAWSILRTEVSRRDEPSGIVAGARDPLESAANRPCTRGRRIDHVLHGTRVSRRAGILFEALDLLASALEMS